MRVTAFAFTNPLIAPIVFDIEGPKDAFNGKSTFFFEKRMEIEKCPFCRTWMNRYVSLVARNDRSVW